MKHAAKLLGLALIAGTVFGAQAGKAEAIDPAQRALVEHFAAAVVAQDKAGLTSLVHPASRACMSAENHDYFDFLFAQDLSQHGALEAGYTLTQFGRIQPDIVSANAAGGMFPAPAAPTHQFQIDTAAHNGHGALTIIRMAAMDHGQWYIVLGCPTAQGLAFFHQHIVEAARQQAEAERLAAALHEPLLSEIKQLVAAGRRIDAVKRYQEAGHVDLTTAMQVIDALDP